MSSGAKTSRVDTAAQSLAALTFGSTMRARCLDSARHDVHFTSPTYGLDPAAARCWVARAGSSLVGGSITGSGAAQPDTVA